MKPLVKFKPWQGLLTVWLKSIAIGYWWQTWSVIGWNVGKHNIKCLIATNIGCILKNPWFSGSTWWCWDLLSRFLSVLPPCASPALDYMLGCPTELGRVGNWVNAGKQMFRCFLFDDGAMTDLPSPHRWWGWHASRRQQDAAKYERNKTNEEVEDDWGSGKITLNPLTKPVFNNLLRPYLMHYTQCERLCRLAPLRLFCHFYFFALSTCWNIFLSALHSVVILCLP